MFDLFARPEASLVYFVVIDVNGVMRGTKKREYEFSFAGTLPHVGTEETGLEFRDTQFFESFPF